MYSILQKCNMGDIKMNNFKEKYYEYYERFIPVHITVLIHYVVLIFSIIEGKYNSF